MGSEWHRCFYSVPSLINDIFDRAGRELGAVRDGIQEREMAGEISMKRGRGSDGVVIYLRAKARGTSALAHCAPRCARGRSPS